MSTATYKQIPSVFFGCTYERICGRSTLSYVCALGKEGMHEEETAHEGRQPESILTGKKCWRIAERGCRGMLTPQSVDKTDG